MDSDPILSMFLIAGKHTISETISIPMLLLTLFLVLLNGFFVAAEFAIVKVRTSQIEVRADVNKRLSKIAKSIVSNLDSYLAATQLGITLASLALGWVGESSMTPVIVKIFSVFGLNDAYWLGIAHKIALPISFVIITILHIVFGELAPKSLAIRFPTNTTFAIAWPLKIFYFVFKPVIWSMNGLANLILRAFGIKPIHGAEFHSEEELKMIISESQEGGMIEETERNLIQNVFDFDDRRVSNILTLRKNVSAIEINTVVKDALEYAINEGYSRYPVYEETAENIKGILYTKDLVKLMLESPEEVSFANILRNPIFISENTKIKNVLSQFQKKHVQMGIVTNETGDFSGIVSLEDIIEELVGEIQDEYDNEDPVVVSLGEGVYSVNAHYNLSDINRYIPYKFEEDERYETLAGLISEEFPNKEFKFGDKIELKNYRVKILKMYRNSVEKVELTLLNNNEESSEESET